MIRHTTTKKEKDSNSPLLGLPYWIAPDTTKQALGDLNALRPKIELESYTDYVFYGLDRISIRIRGRGNVPDTKKGYPNGDTSEMKAHSLTKTLGNGPAYTVPRWHLKLKQKKKQTFHRNTENMMKEIATNAKLRILRPLVNRLPTRKDCWQADRIGLYERRKS